MCSKSKVNQSKTTAAALYDLSRFPPLWRQGGEGISQEMEHLKKCLDKVWFFLRFLLKDYSPLIYLRRPPIPVTQPDNDLMPRS